MSSLSAPPARLPKPPSRFLPGPIARLTSPDYHICRAEDYHEQGNDYIAEIKEKNPDWEGRPELVELLGTSTHVHQMIDDQYTQCRRKVKIARDVKHVSKQFHTDAVRTSKKAKQERLIGTPPVVSSYSDSAYNGVDSDPFDSIDGVATNSDYAHSIGVSEDNMESFGMDESSECLVMHSMHSAMLEATPPTNIDP
ncbi:hypothetical protein C8Q80DRAFT_1272621 [Daedaleopsis nitida]|nr:hypothetical protein C8Q80DRAFT_1272621 [Daedaleopsis nitida]